MRRSHCNPQIMAEKLEIQYLRLGAENRPLGLPLIHHKPLGSYLFLVLSTPFGVLGVH